jgi:hypothetical protein
MIEPTWSTTTNSFGVGCLLSFGSAEIEEYDFYMREIIARVCVWQQPHTERERFFCTSSPVHHDAQKVVACVLPSYTPYLYIHSFD